MERDNQEVLMNLQSYLDEQGVHYRMSQHAPAYTSQDLAAAEHIPGRKVIKPVVVRADGYAASLPRSRDQQSHSSTAAH